MAKKPPQSLTTNEFSKLTGIPVTTVGKLLRNGELKGQKVSGRWMIDADQAKRHGAQKRSPKEGSEKADHSKRASKGPGSDSKKPEAPNRVRAESGPSADAKHFSISEFSRLTYLTDYGVEQYLNSGRLRGTKDAQGNWRIDAANLDDPNIKHLIR